MAKLEQIIDEARFALTGREAKTASQILDLELEQQQTQDYAQPTLSNNGDDDAIRERRLEWLKAHREEYAGEYVALAGDVLVGHGRTIREAHDQAKEKGVENPFLALISPCLRLAECSAIPKRTRLTVTSMRTWKQRRERQRRSMRSTRKLRKPRLLRSWCTECEPVLNFDLE